MADTTLIHQEAVPEKRSYSVAEIAEILGVSKRSVYNLCSAGVIKSVRIGTKLRISKKAFDEWLDGENNSLKESTELWHPSKSVGKSML